MHRGRVRPGAWQPALGSDQPVARIGCARMIAPERPGCRPATAGVPHAAPGSGVLVVGAQVDGALRAARRVDEPLRRAARRRSAAPRSAHGARRPARTGRSTPPAAGRPPPGGLTTAWNSASARSNGRRSRWPASAAAVSGAGWVTRRSLARVSTRTSSVPCGEGDLRAGCRASSDRRRGRYAPSASRTIA